MVSSMQMQLFKGLQLYKKTLKNSEKNLTYIFSSEFFEIFKSTFLTENYQEESSEYDAFDTSEKLP